MTKNSSLYTIETPAKGSILIAPIGDLAELTAQATPADISAVAGSSPKRQREQLTWRNMVRKALAITNNSISYNAVGAPQIDNSEHFISVSHSSSLVAVIISPKRCAIDIERLDRNFGSVASRYISPAESELSGDPQLPAALWCAKESLYKFAGRKELDLLRDIKVVELSKGEFTGVISPCKEPIHGFVQIIESHMLAFIEE